MDEVLYPEEALAFLRQMRYDPDARRVFENLSASFHWSDEGLRQAMRLCRNHDSRATFYTMVFRTSLHQGRAGRGVPPQLGAAPGGVPRLAGLPARAVQYRVAPGVAGGAQADVHRLRAGAAGVGAG
ncbi:MAG TPA: hypothetical protein VG125_21805 [Pirellulales bacterium]|jgi:hypothetical protein|nr:hypothetical protein [Pirellulales bacterium]